jgi:PH and SEC7 domain-containing protein
MSNDFDSDDHSFVQVEQPSQYVESPPPPVDTSKTIKNKSTIRRLPELPNIATKRRSMSVSEVELKQAMAQASSTTPLPANTPAKERKSHNKPDEKRSWDARINGMITDFKGELSQLETFSSGSLDLKDPSTPARRAGLTRSQTDSAAGTPVLPSRRSTLESPLSSPGSSTPVVKLDPPASLEGSQASSQENVDALNVTDVPPRTTSLQTPPRHRSGSNSADPWRYGVGKNGQRAFRSLTADGPGAIASGHQQSTSRLRVQHRSAASSSEPSLIPVGDEGGRTCTCALSFNFQLQFEAWLLVSPFISAKAQQELTQGELTLSRCASNPSLGKSEEVAGDIESRGKELAARCWREDETFLPREKIAEWLGGQ